MLNQLFLNESKLKIHLKLCVFECVCEDAPGGQRSQVSLELELIGIVKQLKWVLKPSSGPLQQWCALLILMSSVY